MGGLGELMKTVNSKEPHITRQQSRSVTQEKKTLNTAHDMSLWPILFFILISLISPYQLSISRCKNYDAVFSVHYSMGDKKWWVVIGLL